MSNELAKTFGNEINLGFFKDIMNNKDSPSIYGEYYLTSCLDYEASRCNLYGNSFIHYIIVGIKMFLKKIGNMMIYNLPLVIETAIQIMIFTIIFLPIIMAVWSAVSKFMCFLVNSFGLGPISIPDFIPLAGGYQIFDGWYPFKTIIFFFFGDIFDCASGPDWANIKYGSCDKRFGGGNASETGCNTGFATDYSLFKEDSDTLCMHSLDCPDAPQSAVLSDSMISGFSPVINTVNRKGTAPFKYLKCCENETQNCKQVEVEQAKRSINYASKFPRKFPGQPDLDKRKFLDPFNRFRDEEEKKNVDFGNFKPVTMFGATDRYFEQNKVWYGVDQTQLGAPTDPHTCTLSTANPLYHWLDVYVLEIREYVKYLLWATVIIFVMYEIYNTIYHIWQGKKFKEKVGAKTLKEKVDDKNLEEHVRGYLCKQKVEVEGVSEKGNCNQGDKINENIENAVKNFMVRYSEGIDHNKSTHKNNVDYSKYRLSNMLFGSTDKTGTTVTPSGKSDGQGAKVQPGSTGMDDKQTIVFGFIMVITFIVLGVVSITTIIKKKKDKERVEITNWPI
jgi:hypothetical protein